MTQAGPSGPGTSNPYQMNVPTGMQGGGATPSPVPPPVTGGGPSQPSQPNPNLAVDRLLETLNIAEHLDEQTLQKMGEAVYEGFQNDLASKADWDKSIDDWIKLASQVREQKSFPWQKSSNVKYPLLSTAAMQFAARAYPSLVPADGKIVNMQVIGNDPDGSKIDKAQRLSMHMNFQLMIDMDDWEEEMDRLLIQLPIVGCLFKKTYFDQIQRKNKSCLLGAKDLIINYWASSLESAYRVSEIIPITKNDYKSMVAAKVYLNKDLEDPTLGGTEALPKMIPVSGLKEPPKPDKATPYHFVEQHTYWDIDGDGYAEPYIITIDLKSKWVLRVVARFDSDGIHTDADGKVICIDPVQYYTKYSFVPNPDGGFYDIGFGHLLGALNESANTIINQLIDAGTLTVLQSGFLGKGLRMKPGENRFQPGEWKQVNAVGDDLRKQIVPLPIKEPSEVLFKLLGMVIESSEKLASVAEIFVGKMPGQNTPATTTMATIEQGMKVFTAIYKRVFRSLTKEFRKLFRLNGLYQENVDRAQHILSEPLDIADYDPKAYNVCPAADPTAVSSTQKLLKAQALLELLQLGTIDPMEVTKRILDAQEQPNIQALIRQGPPPPDPKAQQIQAEMQADSEKHQQDMQMGQIEMAKSQWELAAQQHADTFSQQMKAHDAMMEQRLNHLERIAKIMAQDATAKHSMAMDAAMGTQDMSHQEATHQQSLAHGEEQHAAKLRQQEELTHAKARATARVAKSSGNRGTKK